MKFSLICFPWGRVVFLCFLVLGGGAVVCFFGFGQLKGLLSILQYIFATSGPGFYEMMVTLNANCGVFFIPLTDKIKTWCPSLRWHQFFQRYWLMNSKNSERRCPPTTVKGPPGRLAFICFCNKPVKRPALSERGEWERSPRAEWGPFAGVIICLWQHKHSRGVNPLVASGQLCVQLSGQQALSLPLLRWESSLWFSERMPGLFYTCLPRVLQLLINFLKLP